MQIGDAIGKAPSGNVYNNEVCTVSSLHDLVVCVCVCLSVSAVLLFATGV